ncbi:MAG: hypothetical protein ACM3QX_15310 [Syntrophomonadaceae bacterium]
MPERFFRQEPVSGEKLAPESSNVKASFPESFEDELKMLNKIKFTLCTNTDIVQTLPAFVQAVDTFENYINNITGKYRELKNRLIIFTCRLASAVNTYGVMTENNELIAESSFCEEDLQKQKDDLLLGKCISILEHARIYLQAPNPFGIYHEFFVECETAADDFRYAISRPDFSLSDKNSWKKEHDTLLMGAHEFMYTTLDRLADSLKGKYPGFYREYQECRIVEKPGVQLPSKDKKAEINSFDIPF